MITGGRPGLDGDARDPLCDRSQATTSLDSSFPLKSVEWE